MHKVMNTALLGAALFGTLVFGAVAEAAPSITLPEIGVSAAAPGNPSMMPYSSNVGPRVSSHNTIPYIHFDVPAGYDDNVAMHPYTSAISPCTEGGTGSGCNRPTGKIILPSHYNKS
jgi:hypothetical protein